MRRGPEPELSPQEEIDILKEMEQEISERMINFPKLGDQTGYGDLFIRQKNLQNQIQVIQDSIKSPLGHGPTGEHTIFSSRDPER